MNTYKLVSICIPTYNNEKFIAETLGSVLKQTYPKLEIIITDDASTDRTVEIAESFKDPIIKIIKNDVNLGLTGNWNRSITAAKGDYIKLVCGDDILYPTCVERQFEVLHNDKDAAIALVSSHRDIINSKGKIVLKRKSLFKSGENDSKRVVKMCIRFGANLIGEPMAGMFRKAILMEGIRYDGGNPYLIDLDFWFKLLRLGNLYVINDFLSAFRISSASLSASLNFNQFLLFKRFIHMQRQNKTIGPLDECIGIMNAFFATLLRNIIFNLSTRNTLSRP